MTPEQKTSIQTLIDSHSIVLFMKGEPEQPMCGFSNQVVSILKAHGVSFHGVDILKDQNLRSAMKEYSSWPTFPQLYAYQKFIGGCDIVMEMERNNTLTQAIKNPANT